jgi:hypothetical protein
MSRGPAKFRKSDVKRAAQALESAGLIVGRVELQSGKVVFFPRTEDSDFKPQDESNEWGGAE